MKDTSQLPQTLPINYTAPLNNGSNFSKRIEELRIALGKRYVLGPLRILEPYERAILMHEYTILDRIETRLFHNHTQEQEVLLVGKSQKATVQTETMLKAIEALQKRCKELPELVAKAPANRFLAIEQAVLKETINLLYTPDRSFTAIEKAIHRAERVQKTTDKKHSKSESDSSPPASPRSRRPSFTDMVSHMFHKSTPPLQH